MPYSTDIEANQQNPISPSVVMNMTEQLLYKIAALDASVQSGFRRIDEKMDRFQTDLHESQINLNDRINQLDKEFGEAILFKRQRIDKLEERQREQCEAINHRISQVETWQKILTARMTLAGGVVVAVWTFVAPVIRNAFGLGE